MFANLGKNLDGEFTASQVSHELQHTLKSSTIFNGVGVHSGKPVCMIIHPAPVDHGIIFERTDIEETQNRIKASWKNVKSTNMCTTIANQAGVQVATVEHILAALAAFNITNALITIDSPEVPMVDGCAFNFCSEITESGVEVQQKNKPKLIVKEIIKVVDNHGNWASLSPFEERAFNVSFLPSDRFAGIARNQNCEFIPSKHNFVEQISRARSFGFYEDAQKLWASGLAKGSSLDNTVVIDNGKIMNKDGLHYEDEFVRHKMLDVIGDIALAEYDIIGRYNACNPSHSLNYALVEKYFESLV